MTVIDRLWHIWHFKISSASQHLASHLASSESKRLSSHSRKFSRSRSDLTPPNQWNPSGIQAESKRNPSGIQAESMASMELNGIKWNQMESNRTNRRQILKCRFSYGLVILVTHYRTVSWTEKNSDLPWDFLSKRHMTPSWRNIPNKTNK